LDYYTSGGVTGCPALLVEPAATNLVFHSEQFTTANSYLLRQSTVTNNVTGTLDPAGGNTADQIFPDNSTNLHQILSNDSPNGITFASGTTYTQSVFAKAGSGSQGQRLQSTFSSSRFTGLPFANFNLASGTVTSTGGGATASIQSMGNGWYRCITTAVCNSSGTGGGFFAGLITADNSAREQSFSGIDTHFIYAWGGQMETGSVATSYIPTNTAAVTRNADVISVGGAVSGCIGQTEGTIYAEVDSRNQQTGRIVSFQIAGTAGSGQIRIDTVGASLRCRLINASGTSVFDVTSSPAMSLGINKMAFAFNAAASGIVVALNGSIIATATAVASTVHNATQLTIGAQDSVAGFGSFYNDRIRAVAIYSTRLTNAELQSLTTL
jgi:hypothetical protein